jgi:hypothetical protein
MRVPLACMRVGCIIGVLATAAQAQVVTYRASRAALACRSHEMLARANAVLGSGDGQAWAKFAAVAVFAGELHYYSGRRVGCRRAGGLLGSGPADPSPRRRDILSCQSR